MENIIIIIIHQCDFLPYCFYKELYCMMLYMFYPPFFLIKNAELNTW